MKEKPAQSNDQSNLLKKVVGGDSNLSNLVNLRKILIDDLVFNSNSNSTQQRESQKKKTR